MWVYYTISKRNLTSRTQLGNTLADDLVDWRVQRIVDRNLKPRAAIFIEGRICLRSQQGTTQLLDWDITDSVSLGRTDVYALLHFRPANSCRPLSSRNQYLARGI